MHRILYFLFIPILLFGQIELTDKNQTGIAASIDYSNNNKLNGLGGKFGVSINGKVDIGLQHFNTSFNGLEERSDIQSKFSLLYFAYNIKKSNESNLKFLAGYISNSLNSNDNDGETQSGLLLSMLFTYSVFDEGKLKVIPGLGFTYGFVSELNKKFTLFPDRYYEVFHRTRNLFLQINLTTNPVGNFHFILTPSITKDLANSDYSLIFGITGGVMFSFDNS